MVTEDSLMLLNKYEEYYTKLFPNVIQWDKASCKLTKLEIVNELNIIFNLHSKLFAPIKNLGNHTFNYKLEMRAMSISDIASLVLSIEYLNKIKRKPEEIILFEFYLSKSNTNNCSDKELEYLPKTVKESIQIALEIFDERLGQGVVNRNKFSMRMSELKTQKNIISDIDTIMGHKALFKNNKTPIETLYYGIETLEKNGIVFINNEQ